MEKLLNIDELSKMLGVTKGTIYAWVYQKQIPHVKFTKRGLLKFREKDIMDWISQKTVNTETPDSGKKSRHIARPSSNLSADSIERIIRNAKNEVLNRR